MAYPTTDDMKVWLRLPSSADAELDSRLTELIAAAVSYVEDATGNTFNNESVAPTPDRINLAIKFLAGFWFENPLPEQAETDSCLNAVNNLIAAYRVFSFPADGSDAHNCA